MGEYWVACSKDVCDFSTDFQNSKLEALASWKEKCFAYIEKKSRRTNACGSCRYRGTDGGGPGPAMVCGAKGAKDMGYIVMHEGNEIVSYNCPLNKPNVN